MSAAPMPAMATMTMRRIGISIELCHARLSHTELKSASRNRWRRHRSGCAGAAKRARVYFGHGTDNARDEAAELVFFVAGLDHALGAGAYARPLTARRSARIDELLKADHAHPARRISRTERSFAGSNCTSMSACWCRARPSPSSSCSAFALAPARRVRRILDIGTGSGAIAAGLRQGLSRARVDAVDISAAALQVCRRNVRRLHLEKRVRR
jgi:ribosomal protein L3 glutamine methyltransferase